MANKLGLLCLILFFLQINVNGLKLINKDIVLYLDFSDDGISLSLLASDGKEKMSGSLGQVSTGSVEPEDCDEDAKECVILGEGVNLTIAAFDNTFLFSWESDNIDLQFQDCFHLNDFSWYGGPEQWHEQWPVENYVIDRKLYTTLKSDNHAVSERYWLNSKGGYIFVTDSVPLFVDQNSIQEGDICFIAHVTEPYQQETLTLRYILGAQPNPREAHLDAINYLKKPTGHPDERIIRKPIWTTWAKYKKEINDDVVLAFAQDIADHGFSGQLEIDDYWETCYGSLIFNDDFANINSTVQSIKDLNFTVTLWTHPFVNEDCEETATYGRENSYFVKSLDGNDITSWWDGDRAHYIEFRKAEAAEWFVERLKLLQTTHGIDSFKFDAGESDYAPWNSAAEGDPDAPNSLTSAYVRTCATFGDLIEVRSAWRTQDLPIFVRMLDKDSTWDLENGLHALVTSLLKFNIFGYTMVLPDMIGGNGYNALPTAELLARWTQANTFMPTMQFSYLPWDIVSEEFDGVAIIKKYVDLHEQYADLILEAMDASIADGTPVNPPIWWIDPYNEDALKVNDEFLLGEKILVAPIIEEGSTSRDIVLPEGFWIDGNTGLTFQGPTTLKNYSAPIDILPYFIRQ